MKKYMVSYKINGERFEKQFAYKKTAIQFCKDNKGTLNYLSGGSYQMILCK